jgi:hypothetical protein
MKQIKSLQLCKWPITYTHDSMQIGCQRHYIKKWFGFSDERINKMDPEALAWWKIWKPIIYNIIKTTPAIGPE